MERPVKQKLKNPLVCQPFHLYAYKLYADFPKDNFFKQRSNVSWMIKQLIHLMKQPMKSMIYLPILFTWIP
ncbi:MAG TPA: hypothetical protein VN040_02350 [Pseudosphingobacterium sp.]|nr:hypothetical protein [Pseudosphingobacterium sp.]